MASGYKKISTLAKPQRRLFNRYAAAAAQGPSSIQESPLYQSGQSYLQSILSGSPQASQDFEQPALRQFRQQIIPQIAERFGGLGALSSSGFQQALAGASTDLSERLARIRGEMQQGAAGLGLQYAQAPLEQGNRLLNLETQAYIPKQPAWWQSALIGLTGGASQGIGQGAGMAAAAKYLPMI